MNIFFSKFLLFVFVQINYYFGHEEKEKRREYEKREREIKRKYTHSINREKQRGKVYKRKINDFLILWELNSLKLLFQ